MGNRGRGTALLLAAGTAFVLGAGSLAWACTGQATLVGASPPLGIEGTTVRVEGEAQGLDRRPVEIRWNALDGPVLATAVPDGRNRFTTQFAVPPASPGVHTLLLVAEGQGVGRAPFEVPSPAVGSNGVVPADARPARVDAWNVGSAADSGARGPDTALVTGAALLAMGAVAAAGAAACISLGRRRAVTRSR